MSKQQQQQQRNWVTSAASLRLSENWIGPKQKILIDATFVELANETGTD